MQPPTDKEFYDPALKDAVCRCWGCDCASAELKRKIEGMLRGSGGSAGLTSRPLRRLSWAIWPVAMAACFLLVVTLVHQLQNRSNPTVAASALPSTLQNDLITRHDFCSKLPDHQHLKVAKDDDSAITSALQSTLNRPVLVCHPQDPDWQFRGAAVCPVGSTPAGHLVFVKGTDSLSIFSLPRSLVPTAVEGTQYAISMDQHCIVAFVKNGALFCLVSSGPTGDVNLDVLKKMESQMLPAVADAPPTQSSPVILTELLRPIGP